MAPLLFLIAVGPAARWKQASAADLAHRLRFAGLLAVLAAAGLPFVFGEWTPLVGMGLLLAAWIVSAAVVEIRQRLKAGKPPLSFWGMHLAHIGVAAFVIGVTLVKGYETEQDVRMAPDDTVLIGGYTVRMLGVRELTGPNYRSSMGDFELSRDGKVLRELHPEKRAYLASAMPMTEAAIETNLLRDVYVSMGEPLDDGGSAGAWSVRVHYKPFVVWIWGGCLLMALGGALAIADRRYRLPVKLKNPSGEEVGGAA